MNPNKKLKTKLAAVSAMALALTIGGGTLLGTDAFAASGSNTSATQTQTQSAEKPGFGHFKGGQAALLASDELATLLGLTADELKAKLQAGDSLATIAAAQNVSVDTVIASVTESLKEKLAEKLSDGKITQEQYDTQAATLSDTATKLVNGEFAGKGGRGGGPGGGRGFGGANLASDELAALLGLTADELKTKLQAGDSLATIAAAQNVSVDTVIASVTESLKEKLAEKLSDGKITQEQYDTQAAALSDTATKLVNGEFAGKGGFGGGLGGGQGFGGANLASDELAALLGLTADELKTKLQAGDSLAAIAAAQNVSVDTVIASVTESLKEKLAEKLSDGKITQEQYDTQASALPDTATKLVNGEFAGKGGFGGRGHGGKSAGSSSSSGSSGSSSDSTSTAASANA
ncbi:putative HD phosphohydrolase [Cohnella thailandensis]|uniref:LysM peptidoglycan-binding domain-containing protein n=2 Tax=Cohnella thailandensis TaxID=557557 RepID=A0A841SXH9_9BACL|nr:LysM peptidoglycan-binding domain-containing protein [Cohnella thailandensis]MBP1975893.1 putative HD phosphohydrolase [Cohnella thailandensis]